MKLKIISGIIFSLFLSQEVLAVGPDADGQVSAALSTASEAETNAVTKRKIAFETYLNALGDAQFPDDLYEDGSVETSGVDKLMEQLNILETQYTPGTEAYDNYKNDLTKSLFSGTTNKAIDSQTDAENTIDTLISLRSDYVAADAAAKAADTQLESAIKQSIPRSTSDVLSDIDALAGGETSGTPSPSLSTVEYDYASGGNISEAEASADVTELITAQKQVNASSIGASLDELIGYQQAQVNAAQENVDQLQQNYKTALEFQQMVEANPQEAVANQIDQLYEGLADAKSDLADPKAEVASAEQSYSEALTHAKVADLKTAINTLEQYQDNPLYKEATTNAREYIIKAIKKANPNLSESDATSTLDNLLDMQGKVVTSEQALEEKQANVDSINVEIAKVAKLGSSSEEALKTQVADAVSDAETALVSGYGDLQEAKSTLQTYHDWDVQGFPEEDAPKLKSLFESSESTTSLAETLEAKGYLPKDSSSAPLTVSEVEDALAAEIVANMESADTTAAKEQVDAYDYGELDVSLGKSDDILAEMSAMPTSTQQAVAREYVSAAVVNGYYGDVNIKRELGVVAVRAAQGLTTLSKMKQQVIDQNMTLAPAKESLLAQALKVYEVVPTDVEGSRGTTGLDADTLAFITNYNTVVADVRDEIIKALANKKSTTASLTELEKLAVRMQGLQDDAQTIGTAPKKVELSKWQKFIKKISQLFSSEKEDTGPDKDAILSSLSSIKGDLAQIQTQTTEDEVSDTALSNADSALPSEDEMSDDTPADEAYKNLVEQLDATLEALNKSIADANNLPESEREAVNDKIQRLTSIAEGLAKYKEILAGKSPLDFLEGDEQSIESAETGLADELGGAASDDSAATAAFNAASEEIESGAASIATSEELKGDTAADAGTLEADQTALDSDVSAIDAKASALAKAFDEVIQADIDRAIDIASQLQESTSVSETDITAAINDLTTLKANIGESGINVLTKLKTTQTEVQDAVAAEASEAGSDTKLDTTITTLQTNMRDTVNALDNPATAGETSVDQVHQILGTLPPPDEPIDPIDDPPPAGDE